MNPPDPPVDSIPLLDDRLWQLSFGERAALTGILSQLAGHPKTVLKFLDEYFYAKYTRRWV